MQMRIVGLGRMGLNMAARWVDAGFVVIGYDLNPQVREEAERAGIIVVNSLEELVDGEGRLIVWSMLKAGEITTETIHRLGELLPAGAIVIDGANSHFRNSIKYAKHLKERGIQFLDVGVSGGVHGRTRGYCLMVGGDRESFDVVEPFLVALAPGPDAAPRARGRQGDYSMSEKGYLHCGPAGAGAFSKLVHNAIEYGGMQAIVEGLALLCAAAESDVEEERFDLDTAEIFELWRRGSVVMSWLVDLMAEALYDDPKLEKYSGLVGSSGAAEWAVNYAMERKVPLHVIAASLFARFRSLIKDWIADKALSALRKMFGGHPEEDR